MEAVDPPEVVERQEVEARPEVAAQQEAEARPAAVE